MEKFERVKKVKYLYRRQYRTANGDWSTIYYGRFVDWKGKRRMFSLGNNLDTAKDELELLRARNVRKEDFDADKMKTVPAPALERMTVKAWAALYLEREETKRMRSYDRVSQLTKPLGRLLGDMLLIDLTHDDLVEYSEQRKREFVIRGGNESKVNIKAGTIANELSCLRAMLNVAFMCKDQKIQDGDGVSRRKYPGLEGFTINVSFKGLIKRGRRSRVLSQDEETALLEHYPVWMRRVCIVANETCLSQGDIIRLTDSMIDRRLREIVPEGGRKKTQGHTDLVQRAPLTDRVIEILDDIRRDRLAGKIVANVNGLVFTRNDGAPITKDMIEAAMKTALRLAKIKDFRFHDYRHCAQTRWAEQGISVDAAMVAAGHSSVEMHKRYVNLQQGSIAKHFGLKVATRWQHESVSDKDKAVTS